MQLIADAIAQSSQTTSLPVTLGVTAVLGLFLLTMGRKLARPAISICGLFMGAVGMFITAHHMQVTDRMVIIWVSGGAAAGLLLAWLLFRWWMAISLGAIGALMVSAAGVMMGDIQVDGAEGSRDQGTEVDATEVDGTEEKRDRRAEEDDALVPRSLDPSAPRSFSVSPEQVEKAKEAADSAITIIQDVYENQRAYITQWWHDLHEDGQRNLTISAVIGGLVGALMGFAMPYFSASIQTALVGSAMLLSGVRGLLAEYAPAQTQWMPQEPKSLLITMCLITLLGILVQWTFWRKQADK